MIGRFSFFNVRYPIIDKIPIIMHTDKKTIPAILSTIVSSDSDETIKAGVARYITKSFNEERSIFFHLPNRYPIKAIRKTGSTTLIISIISADIVIVPPLSQGTKF